jgi:hypothetical protein
MVLVKAMLYQGSRFDSLLHHLDLFFGFALRSAILVVTAFEVAFNASTPQCPLYNHRIIFLFNMESARNRKMR